MLKKFPKGSLMSLEKNIMGEEPINLVSKGIEYQVSKLPMDAAIGYREFYEHTCFVLWLVMPRGTDDVFETEPVLEIRSGPREAGVWVYGMGQKMVTDVVLGEQFS